MDHSHFVALAVYPILARSTLSTPSTLVAQGQSALLGRSAQVNGNATLDSLLCHKAVN